MFNTYKTEFSYGSLDREIAVKILINYFEQTKGYETQFLNNILRPIINDTDVQYIIVNNISFYEPLLKNNIIQASSLRNEMIKLYENTSNASLKEMIGRLNLVDKNCCNIVSGEN